VVYLKLYIDLAEDKLGDLSKRQPTLPRRDPKEIAQKIDFGLRQIGDEMQRFDNLRGPPSRLPTSGRDEMWRVRST
jgi:hypothetical protein